MISPSHAPPAPHPAAFVSTSSTVATVAPKFSTPTATTTASSNCLSRFLPASKAAFLPSAVLRYIERNLLRAALVSKAEDWHSSSLRWHFHSPHLAFLHAGPVPRSPDWAAHINAPQTQAELAALRRSVERGAPFGAAARVKPAAARLGLEFTLCPRG